MTAYPSAAKNKLSALLSRVPGKAFSAGLALALTSVATPVLATQYNIDGSLLDSNTSSTVNFHWQFDDSSLESVTNAPRNVSYVDASSITYLTVWNDDGLNSPPATDGFSINANGGSLSIEPSLGSTNIIAGTTFQDFLTASSHWSEMGCSVMYIDPDSNFYDGPLTALSVTPATVTLPQSTIQDMSLADNVVRFNYTAVPPHSYQVQSSTNLGSTNWVNQGSPHVSTGVLMPFAKTAVAAQEFYRVVTVN